jgi:hypothetical protein
VDVPIESKKKTLRAISETPSALPIWGFSRKKNLRGGLVMSSDAQDQISKIMGEIDELRKEISESSERKTEKNAEDVLDAKAKLLADLEDLESEDSSEESSFSEEDLTDLEELSAEFKDDSEENLDELQDFRGGSDEVPMEEMLGEIEEEVDPNGRSLIDASLGKSEGNYDEKTPPLKVVESHHSNDSEESRPSSRSSVSSEPGTLSLSVSGEMTLKLCYEQDGNHVTVHMKEDAMCIELSDGTEFKVPLRRGERSLKKAS